jgi:hypothetical protein
MLDLELVLLTLTGIGLILGCLGIFLTRVCRTQRPMSWGRAVFVFTLLGLGAAGLVAAFHRADGLAPLGLVAGFLVIGMLWEVPHEYRTNADAFPAVEEI